MATIKFGPIVADARGKIGGIVFSRSRTGPFARSWVKPTHSATNIRALYKSSMSQVFTRWRDIVSPAERDDWNTLATNTTFTNSIGSSYNPSGWNLYFRTNGLLLPFNRTPVDVAPANAIATHYEISYSWNVPNEQIAAECSTDYPDATSIFFFGSAGRSQTIYSLRGPYIVSTRNLASDIKGAPQLLVGFYYDPELRVFIRDRCVDADGAVSGPFFQSYDIPVP